MSLTTDQLKLNAAAILAFAEGKPIQFQPHGYDWMAASAITCIDSTPYRPAPILMPEPPPGESWHNPDNLTAEQFGAYEGWRPLCVSELDGRHGTPEKAPIGTTQKWDGKKWINGNGGLFAMMDSTTYRTKTPFAPKPVWFLSRHIPGFRPLRDDEQWHRQDFTEEMLPPGWRPLLNGEQVTENYQVIQGVTGWTEVSNLSFMWEIYATFARTRSPLPEPTPTYRNWSSSADLPSLDLWIENELGDWFKPYAFSNRGVLVKGLLLTWPKCRRYSLDSGKTWHECRVLVEEGK